MLDLLVYIFTFQWLFPKKKESPEEKANRIIAASSVSLEETERALERSAEHVRKKNGKVTMLAQDATVLKERGIAAISKGREVARPIMEELIAKEKELEEAREDAQAARTTHSKLERAKDDHRKEIRQAKEDLEDLKVRGSTAEARKRSTDRDSLKDVTDGVKTDVRTKETQADLESDLRQNPEDEYLNAAGSSSVDDRLAQLERETK